MDDDDEDPEIVDARTAAAASLVRHPPNRLALRLCLDDWVIQVEREVIELVSGDTERSTGGLYLEHGDRIDGLARAARAAGYQHLDLEVLRALEP